MINVIGIDPGVSGAVCILSEDTGNKEHIMFLSKCPYIKKGTKKEYDRHMMSQILENWPAAKVYIEAVGARPGQGTVSMYNFGKGVGIWLGITAALKLPLTEVSPRKWKKDMILGADKSKGASILRAKELYPGINLKPTTKSKKDDDGLAEAYLIAKYGLMVERGGLK